MDSSSRDVLMKLSDLGETIELGDEDIRGYSVKDKHGADLGKVHELLVDRHQSKVRFFVVESGGFLGLGETKSFIPVEAITEISDDEVHIDQTMDTVAAAPPYDPNLVNDRPHQEISYSHYGFEPFWMSGGAYPGIDY